MTEHRIYMKTPPELLEPPFTAPPPPTPPPPVSIEQQPDGVGRVPRFENRVRRWFRREPVTAEEYATRSEQRDARREFAKADRAKRIEQRDARRDIARAEREQRRHQKAVEKAERQAELLRQTAEYKAMFPPSYVYTYYSKWGTVLYVGVTDNPRRRDRQHQAKHWYRKAVRRELLEFPDRFSAETAERDMIRKLQPKHNIVHKRR